VLLDNGHQLLEPFVLTAGRRPRHGARIIEGLDVVPVAGFDRLAVVWPLSVEVHDQVDTPAGAPAALP
jgi:hypothetical protein